MDMNYKELFELIKNDNYSLNLKWIFFKQLYSTNTKRIELLNASCAAFFGVTENILWEDIISSLCRLTDRCKTGNTQENAVLLRLITMLEESHPHEQLIVELKEICSELEKKMGAMRLYRHKIIAHRDLKAALHEKTVDGVKFDDIKDSILLINKFLNAVESHFDNSTTMYEDTFTEEPGGDGDGLIRRLKESYVFRELAGKKVIDLLEYRKTEFGDA